MSVHAYGVCRRKRRKYTRQWRLSGFAIYPIAEPLRDGSGQSRLLRFSYWVFSTTDLPSDQWDTRKKFPFDKWGSSLFNGGGTHLSLRVQPQRKCLLLLLDFKILDIETTDHLFSCVHSNNLLENMSYWLKTTIQSLPTFARKHIIFRMLLDAFFIYVMLILGKFFIHKCKCMKMKPYFSVFKRGFICIYFPSLQCLKTKKAQNLLFLFTIILTYLFKLMLALRNAFLFEFMNAIINVYYVQ